MFLYLSHIKKSLMIDTKVAYNSTDVTFSICPMSNSYSMYTVKYKLVLINKKIYLFYPESNSKGSVTHLGLLSTCICSDSKSCNSISDYILIIAKITKETRELITT